MRKLADMTPKNVLQDFSRMYYWVQHSVGHFVSLSQDILHYEAVPAEDYDRAIRNAAEMLGREYALLKALGFKFKDGAEGMELIEQMFIAGQQAEEEKIQNGTIWTTEDEVEKGWGKAWYLIND